VTAVAHATSAAMEDVAARFRARFAGDREAFAGFADDARIGFVARADFAAIGGRRLDGLRQAGARAAGAPMLAFVARGGTLAVERGSFEGFEAAAVDLLFVADDEALAALARAGGDPLGEMKRALRTGGVMFYAMKPKHALQELGYEDFLDSLGLAFLGACR
jgi:hypothetical protein